MAGFSLSFELDTSLITRRLARLLERSGHLEPAWQDAAEYMKNSTVNRILRTKKSPEGERWAALSEVTIELKGHDKPLFETGELSNSIGIGDVSNDGFEIFSASDYASYMQEGVQTLRGAFRSKKPAPQVPPRPFMGFSDENMKRISQILHNYLTELD